MAGKAEPGDRALWAADGRIRPLLDLVRDAIFLYDLSGRLLEANAAACERLGYSRRELLDRALADIQPPDDAERLSRRLEEALRKGGGVFEATYVARDGRRIPVELDSRAIEYEGKPAVLSVARETTWRQGAAETLKRRLEEIKQAEAALREEHSFRSGIIRRAAEGLCVCHEIPDPPFVAFTVWNERMTQITGYGMEEINRLGWYQTMYPDPEIREQARRRMDRTRRGEDLRAEEWEIARADGQKRTVSISTSVLEAADGTVHVLALMDDVTERKRAEAALRESQRFLQDVFDGIQDGISVLDRDLTIVRVNRWIEKTYAAEAPLVGRKCYEVYQKRRSRCPWCPSVRTIETGRGHTEVVPYPSAEDQRGWIELSSYPLKDPGGRVTGVVEHVKDITVRKRAELALRKERDLLERITETSPVGIVLADRDGRTVFANAAAEKVLGLRKGPMRQMADDAAAWKITDFEGAPVAEEELPFARVKGSGQPIYDVRHAIEGPDGQRVFLSVNAAPLFDEAGRFDGMVAAIADITQHVRAEGERQVSQKRYRALYESSPDGYAQVDMAGRIVACNSAFRDMLGYCEEELRSRTYSDITPQRWHAEEARILREQVFRRGYSDVYEKEYVRKDGAIIPIEIRTYLLTDPAGKPAGMWAFVRDITERRGLEEQFRQAQKMEAVGRLAGGIAHDFNNQLTVIKGYCDLLLGAGGDQAAGVRDELEEIRQACQRAQRLTHQLLAFSRKQMLRPEVIGLNDVLTEMYDPLSRMIGEDVQLSIVTDPDLGRVKVDRSQVEQVVMNLAVNARDAMPSGGRLLIETANVVLDEEYARQHPEATAGEHVMLAVSDTGMGMDAETARRIFEPFFTTKEEGKGTGLGLSMVYGFVRQSGGSIYVYSEKGRGTTLKVYLPRVFEAGEQAPQAPDGQLLPGGEETVLVVEDDQVVRQFLVHVLRKLGYTVLEAANAHEALPLAEQYGGEIHLLLSDVVMPAMSGPELAERLHARRGGLSVLYVSGYTQEGALQQGVLKPGANLLAKPFGPADLARMVRRALSRRAGPTRGGTVEAEPGLISPLFRRAHPRRDGRLGLPPRLGPAKRVAYLLGRAWRPEKPLTFWSRPCLDRWT